MNATDCWIGIDTGGTFTDVVLIDRASGTYSYRKVPSDPQDPAAAILRGLDEILAEVAVPGPRVGFVGLGTTLATNAVLEGKTGRTGMLTTAGFADILELARQRRPHLYNLDVPKPRSPIAPTDRIEVVERLDDAGGVVTPLDTDRLKAALADWVRTRGLDSVAICFLHAYRNPAHERAAAAVLRTQLPDVPICLSSDVSPEFREFERFTTTALNAALLPVMDRYLERFEHGVAQRGIPVSPYVIQSNGGLVSPTSLRRLPINTFFSGPAGGVVGSVALARDAEIDDFITIDIGGTSTDVCLVRGGRPVWTAQREVAGLPVRCASIDLHTIGAGGGSLAWVDPGGLPKVGPQSAGAVPGPACYDRGGTRPTVTDANVVLGRLNPTALLGGRMPIDAAAAAAAIDQHVAAPLGLETTHAAAGILEIATVGIIGAVRVISVERGEDPRGCALLAFGGGGPLHAAEVAEMMEMRRVVVPPHPGLMSAIGLLAADLRADFGMTCLARATPADWMDVAAALATLAARAHAWAADERLDPAALVIERALELRYCGQSSELRIPLPAGADPLPALCAAFHAEHARRFGYEMPERTVEIVTARLTALAPRPPPPPPRPEPLVTPRPSSACRQVWFAATGFVPTPVTDRANLAPGTSIAGPAIIEQMDATTVIPPGWVATVDRRGNLLLVREER